jgi:glycosyltransferase involved in cell wall biosynthesis
MDKREEKRYIADIIIPHHDRDDLLENCLKNIPEEKYNILIVSGGTFAENCNRGAKMAKTENLIFLNDDTEIQEKFLEQMSSMDADIVGIAQKIPGRNKLVFGLGFELIEDDGSGKRKTARFFAESPKDVLYPSGYFFRVKKSVWESLGGFNEDFKNGCEDGDLFLRAIEKGCTLDYIHEPAIHFHSQSEGRNAKDDYNSTLFDNLWDHNRINNLIINKKGFLFKMNNVVRWTDVDRCPYCGKRTDRTHVSECEKNSPLISVIIPSRVGEEIETLSSLKNQTYKNIEIIVEFDANQEGAPATRNRGAKKAKGEYWFFCDNDLELSPSCLSDLYIALKSDLKANWSFGKFYIDGNLYNEGKDETIPMKGTADWVYYFMGMSTMSLIDARIKPVFDEKMLRFNDWDLWLTLNSKGYKPVFCDKILFSTKNRKNGISKICKDDQAKWTNKLYEKHNVYVFHDIVVKNQMIEQKSREIQQKDREIFAITNSLRWKIPNYFYKIYKRRIKKFVPKSFFKAKDKLAVVAKRMLTKLKGVNFRKYLSMVYSENPKITIGIASYNHAKYLKKCIDSALAQKYKYFDIVIIDDNSTDSDNKNILKFYENHPKVKVICKKQNEGISASLNDQVINAKGDWVAFLDCDDYLPDNALSAMASFIKANPKRKLIYSNRIEVDEEGKFLRKVWFGNRAENKDVFAELMKGMVSSHIKIIHKDVFRKVGLFDPRFGGTHDYDFFLRTAFYMPSAIGFIDKYLYYHRIHGYQNTLVEDSKHKINVEMIKNEAMFRKEVYEGRFQDLISIIILSFNRGKRLKKTIEKILKYSGGINKEIIIWDNKSDDPNTKIILNLLEKRENVRVFYSDKNLRCSGGRREASKLAKGNYLFFLDNDIEISEGTIEELVLRLSESEDIVAGCCKVIFPDKKVQFNGGDYFENDGFIKFSLIDNKKQTDDVSTMLKRDLKWIPGGATIFKREVFDSLEHDGSYLNAFEDNDFSFSITRIMKKRVVNCPTAPVIHFHYDYEWLNDKGNKKYAAVRRNRNDFLSSWVHFYRKWNLVIDDDFIIKVAGLKDEKPKKILEYVRNFPE